MKHTLQGLYDQNSKISILENPDEKTCKITNIYNKDEISVDLDIKKLHSFIGTLLHVQAKLKNL